MRAVAMLWAIILTERDRELDEWVGEFVCVEGVGSEPVPCSGVRF